MRLGLGLGLEEGVSSLGTASVNNTAPVTHRHVSAFQSVELPVQTARPRIGEILGEAEPYCIHPHSECEAVTYPHLSQSPLVLNFLQVELLCRQV